MMTVIYLGRASLWIMVVLASLGVDTAHAQAPRLEKMTFVISAGAGGGIDTYGRTLIAHYAAHIPGKPAIVAQNMPGAGGITATRYLYKTAPADGSYIGLVHSSMIDLALFHKKDPGFDIARVNWIGNLGSNPSLCIAWHTSPFHTIEDLKKATFLAGGAGAFSGSEVNARVLNDVAGTKIKVISGYPSGNAIDLAMEREEVQGRCATSVSSIQASHPEWLKENKVRFLVQMGLSRDSNLPDVPSIVEVIPDEKGKSIVEALFGRRQMQRPVLAPPGVPAPVVEMLRRSFDATVKDPAFLADAQKRGIDIEPLTGEQCAALVKRIYALPPETIAAARSLFVSEDK